MKAEEIKERIAKKEAQIAKIEKRVAKWSKGLTPEVVELGKTLSYAEMVKYKAAHPELTYRADPKDWTYGDVDELRHAWLDLQDAQNTLTKYKNALKIADEKENTEKIQILVDFLNNWKKEAKEYVYNNVKDLENYYKANVKYCDIANNRYKYEQELGLAGWKKLKTDAYNEEKRLYALIHPWTLECYKRSTSSIDENKLNELVNNEAERKYFDLVERITSKVGEIKDVSLLKIDPKGNLNGYVTGDKAKAYVQTIVAGGNNAGVIVNVRRGPIAHYRTIVSIVK